MCVRDFQQSIAHSRHNVSLLLIIKYLNNVEENKIHPKGYHPGGLLPAISLWAEAHEVFYINVIYGMYCSNTLLPTEPYVLEIFSISVYLDLHRSLKMSINELQFICLIYRQLVGGKVVSNFSPS